MNAYVLIDPGATHSFVSSTFVMHVNRRLEPLIDALLIHIPVGSGIVIDHVYRDCEIEIDNVVMLIAFLPLELVEFDVILGMDFLFRYHATVDCFKKKVKFEKPGEAVVVFKGSRKILPTCLVSAVKARRMMSKGCEAYLAHVIEVKSGKLKSKDMPVIHEYLDVFPKELSGLPVDQEIEFTIDLILGTTPIS